MPWSCFRRSWRSMSMPTAACPCWSILSTWTRPSGRSTRRDHRWPLSWLYRREGERLLAYERAVAARAPALVSSSPRTKPTLFRRLAPESAASVDAMSNGVDADFFSPDPARASPFPWRPHSGADTAGVHRRHGLLAQHRCRDLVCQRHPAAPAPAVAPAALLHRRAQPDRRRCWTWPRPTWW